MSRSHCSLLVAGFHRSGTSLSMQTLVRAGLRVGDDLVEAGPSNPDGHFECRSIVRFHDRLLAARGGRWLDLPEGLDNWSSAELDEAAELADTLRGDHRSPWGFKDPRVCLFLPLWDAVLENPLRLVIYRDPIACVDSLLVREAQSLAHHPAHYARRLPFWRAPSQALRLWCQYNERLLEDARRHPQRSLVLSFTQVRDGASPVASIKRRFALALDDSATEVKRVRSRRDDRTIMPFQTDTQGLLERAYRLLDGFDDLTEGMKERRSSRVDDADSETGVPPLRFGRVLAQLQALGVDAPRTGAEAALGIVDEGGPRPSPVESARALDAASAAAPRDAGLAFQAGCAWRVAGDPDAARACLERSLALDGHNHAASLHLGLLARDSGDDEQALVHFEQALDRSPTLAGLHAHVSGTLARLGRHDRAVNVAQLGLALQAEHEDLLETAVHSLRHLHRLDEAAQRVDQASARMPDSMRIALLRYEIAIACGHRSERDAQPLLRHALALRLRTIDGAADALLDAVNALPLPQARPALLAVVEREFEAMIDAGRQVRVDDRAA